MRKGQPWIAFAGAMVGLYVCMAAASNQRLDLAYLMILPTAINFMLYRYECHKLREWLNKHPEERDPYD